MVYATVKMLYTLNEKALAYEIYFRNVHLPVIV